MKYECLNFFFTALNIKINKANTWEKIYITIINMLT